MKRFLLGIVAFLIPVAAFFVALEALVHTIPNSYSYKYQFVKEHGETIKAIALGHSQLYDDFMPEVFKLSSFNLCNSSQFYKEDYYILRELLPYMPNLKLVILPIGYVNVKESEPDQFSDRSTFYHEYMNIDFDGQIPISYRFECFEPKRAFEKITSYYLHHIDIVGCDSMGRRSTHNLSDRHQSLDCTNMLQLYTLNTHDQSEMMIWGESYLVEIGMLLQSKDIQLILVSPPHYWAYLDDINTEQKTFLQEHIKMFHHKFAFQYINLENDKRFVDEDFFDDAHLTELGAEKFTKILNNSIKNI